MWCTGGMQILWLYKLKVLWLGSNDDVTWEPESSVTKEMVEDFRWKVDNDDDDGPSKDYGVKRSEDEAI